MEGGHSPVLMNAKTDHKYYKQMMSVPEHFKKWAPAWKEI